MGLGVEVADAVALLESGLPPERAWAEADVEVGADGLPQVHGASTVGIRAAAQLARDGGVPLARVLRRIVEVERERQEARDACEAALAGPGMSAKVLAWLPLAGVGLAALLDPRALGLLFTTPFGWVLLTVGGILTMLGRAWTRSLLRDAVPSPSGVATPVALALIEATLAAGMDLPGALMRVGRVVEDAGDTEGAALASAGASLARGEPWARVWATAARVDGSLAPVVERALRAPHRCGASAAPALRTATDEAIRTTRAQAQRAVGRLGVTLSLPLTLCLLPAFVVVGIVPMIAAVVGSVELSGL